MFSSEYSYFCLGILDFRKIGARDKLDGICTSETGIISDGRMNEHINRRWEIIPCH